MCTYAYVRFVTGFSPFFTPLGPLGLMIVRYFPKKCGNAAMPCSDKDTSLKDLLNKCFVCPTYERYRNMFTENSKCKIQEDSFQKERKNC